MILIGLIVHIGLLVVAIDLIVLVIVGFGVGC